MRRTNITAIVAELLKQVETCSYAETVVGRLKVETEGGAPAGVQGCSTQLAMQTAKTVLVGGTMVLQVWCHAVAASLALEPFSCRPLFSSRILYMYVKRSGLLDSGTFVHWAAEYGLPSLGRGAL